MVSKTFYLLLPALATAAQIRERLHQQQPRQTASPAASACLADLESVATSYPTVPRELVGLTDIKPITDPCDYTPPATMATAFSSYQSVVISWVAENWPKVESVLDKCPQLSSDVAGFSQQLDLIVCTSKNGGSSTTETISGVVEPTSTGSASGKETTRGMSVSGGATTTAGSAGAQSTTKSSGSARETGFVTCMIAAVGFVGAVIAL